MKDSLRLMIGGIVLFGLGLSFYSSVIETEREFWTALVRHFSFLTIITNWLIVFAMMFPVLAKDTKAGEFFDRAGVQSAVLDYIIIVALGYHFLLSHLYTYQGADVISNFVIHYISPLLTIIAWILLTNKKALTFSAVPVWLLAPLAYMIYCILRGELTGIYPYDLINADKVGHGAAFTVYGAFLVGYSAIGCLIVAVSKLPVFARN